MIGANARETRPVGKFARVKLRLSRSHPSEKARNVGRNVEPKCWSRKASAAQGESRRGRSVQRGQINFDSFCNQPSSPCLALVRFMQDILVSIAPLMRNELNTVTSDTPEPRTFHDFRLSSVVPFVLLSAQGTECGWYVGKLLST